MSTYPGRDSTKDIAARLEQAEPLIDETAFAVKQVERQVAALPDPAQIDPGDLVQAFRNALA